jgi:hypothetical protein
MDDAALQCSRHERDRGQLVWKDRVSKTHILGTDMFPCEGHDLRKRDSLRFRECCKHGIEPEEVIAVAVRDIYER